MKTRILAFALLLAALRLPAADTLTGELYDNFHGEISALGRVLLSDTLRVAGLDAQYARFINFTNFELTVGLTIFDVRQDTSHFTAFRGGPGVQYNLPLKKKLVYFVPWVNAWLFFVDPAIQGYYVLLSGELGAGFRFIISQNGSLLLGATVNKFTYISGVVPSAELRFSVFFDRILN